MEDLVNMSLADVIQKEKAKRKQKQKKDGHVKAKNKQHQKPQKAPAKQKHTQPKPQGKPKQKPAQQVAPKGGKPKAVPAEAKEGKRRVLIKNLHTKADNTTLFKHFKQFGTMTRCTVNFDQMGKSKGTAIVQYEDASNAAKAIKASNGVELKGQAIEVSYA